MKFTRNPAAAAAVGMVVVVVVAAAAANVRFMCLYPRDMELNIQSFR